MTDNDNTGPVAERDYEVTMTNVFTASTPADAVRQMAEWAIDHATRASYWVEWEDGGEDGDTIGMYIDASDMGLLPTAEDKHYGTSFI